MTLNCYYRGFNTLLFTLVLAIAPGRIWADPAKDAEKLSAQQMLPQSVALYLEVTHPEKLTDYLVDHPISKKIQSLDQFKQAMQEPQIGQVNAVIALLEGQVGMKWPEALKKASGGGIVVAFDPHTEGAVVMVKAKDPAVLIKIRDGIFNMIRAQVALTGGQDPIKSSQYRDLTVHPLGNGAGLAIIGPWLIATNKGELGQLVLDNLIDKPSAGTLAHNKQFTKAMKQVKANNDPAAWGYVSLQVLRDAGVAYEVFNDKIDNPLLEALVGPIQSGLQQAPYAVATIDTDDKGFRLSAAVPYDPSKIAKARGYAFATSGGGAPSALKPKGTVATVVGYRDIAGMWQAKDALFSEQTAAGMDQGDSQFSTILGGISFSTEFLTQMKPNVQIVAARQDYKAANVPTPPIQIPAGAYIFQAKNPKVMQDQMALAMQALLTFTNAEAKGMRPALVQREIERGSAVFITTRYASMGSSKSKQGQMHHNFTPTVAFWKDYVMVCSTKVLAEDLVKELESKGPTAISSKVNARMEINGKVSAALIRDNFEALAVQNTLEQGQTIEEAKAQLKLLVDVVEMIDGAYLVLNADGKWMSLELGIEAPVGQSTRSSK